MEPENTELLNSARQEAEALRAELEQQRQRLNNTEQALDNVREANRNNINRHQLRETFTKNRLTVEREHLKSALAIAHEGEQSFEVTSPEAMAYIGKALKIARLMGFGNEARQMADGLGIMETWEHIDAESLPEAQEDKETSITETQRQTLRVSSVHPLDPRLEAVWKRCLAVAQEAGMCGVYEDIAKKVGIPTDYEVAYAGYIEVYVSGSVSVEVSGTATRHDIVNGNLDYDFDIADYIHDLDYNIEGSEIEVTTD
jgi:alkylated DNA nucleotide flippase Atl1